MPPTQLDGNTRAMPQGKVLGGGSILNAMCWNRGGSDDFDAWEALGNPGWGWGRHSIVLHEGKGVPAQIANIIYVCNRVKHTPGYILKRLQKNTPSTTILLSMAPLGLYKSVTPSISIPSLVGPFDSFDIALQLTVLVNLFAGMNLLGLPTQFDPNDGSSAGPAFVPTDLDPNNQTRSDARRTYFDPYVSRSNFHIITGQHVIRILIDGVGSNNAVSTPAAGGNTDGNGPSSGQ